MAQKIEILIEAIDHFTGKSRLIRKEINDLRDGLQTTTQNTFQAEKGFLRLEKSVKTTTRGMRRFRAEFLSILFFGMAIQRIFGGILRTSVDTFKKIAQGSELASKSFGALGAGLTFLKFTLGSVIARFLEPFIPRILDIIEGIADWISQHKTLTAVLILGSIALGSFLVFMGIWELGMRGIQTALAGIIGTKGFPALIGLLKSPVFLAAAILFGLMATALAKHPEALSALLPQYEKLKNELGIIGGRISLVIEKITGAEDAWLFFASVGTSVLSLLISMFTALFVSINFVIDELLLLGQVFADFIRGLATGDFDFSLTKERFEDLKESGGRFWDILSSIQTPMKIYNELLSEQSKIAHEDADRLMTVAGTTDLTGQSMMSVQEPINQTSLAFLNQKQIIDELDTSLNRYIDTLSRAESKALRRMSVPSFQSGGIVPRTGLAMLHQGELVVPKHMVNSVRMGNISTTVNTGTLSSTLDVNSMAQRVSNVIMRDIRKHITPITQYG